MGIQGLARLIADVAPDAIREVDLASFFGRRIAIDASMSLYQFLVAIRHSNHVLTNESGEATSHIIGFFYRTCKLLEAGIKPIYVFDGKPPQLKSGELDKRKERRADAQKKLDEATTAAEAEKFEKRLVKVTKNHNDDVKRLLRLLGLPVIEAPSEAEAQCAQMCKEGLVYGVATEDMDALTFGSTKVIRNLSSGSGEKVKEYDLSKVLQGLNLTHEEFIDLSILMGCDYCDTIRGIGPKKGLDLIRKHHCIEDVLREKFNVTEFIEDVEVTYRGDRTRDTDTADMKPPATEYVNKVAKKFSGIHDAIKAKVEQEVSKWDDGQVKSESEIEDRFNKELDKEVSPASSPSSSPKKEPSTPKKKKELSTPKKKEPSTPQKSDVSDGEIKFMSASDDDYDAQEDADQEKEDEEEDAPSDSEVKVPDDDEEEEAKSKKTKKGKGKATATKKAASTKGKKEAGEKKPMFQVPDNWLFKGARRLFVEPNVLKNTITESDLKIKDVDEAGLINFLVSECAFNEDRVRTALKRIESFKKKSSQSRIDSFFKTIPKSPVKKRPAEESKGKGSKGAAAASKATASKRGRRGR